jgi:hypothetical protein
MSREVSTGGGGLGSGLGSGVGSRRSSSPKNGSPQNGSKGSGIEFEGFVIGGSAASRPSIGPSSGSALFHQSLEFQEAFQDANDGRDVSPISGYAGDRDDHSP